MPKSFNLRMTKHFVFLELKTKGKLSTMSYIIVTGNRKIVWKHGPY